MKTKKKNKKAQELAERFKFHEIDKNRLDDEWMELDLMFGYYSELMIDAKERRDAADTAFKLKESKIKRKIRRRPEDYGLEKATNDPVEEQARIELKDCKEEKIFNEANREVAELGIALDRLRIRVKAIGDLISLWQAGYFQGVKKPKGMTRDGVKKMEESRMNRRSMRE